MVRYTQTVTSIFSAMLDERQTPAALQAVAEYVGASGASYLRVNRLTGRVNAVARWGSFTGGRAAYLNHYSTVDPFREILEKAPCGKLIRLSETLPRSVLRDDEWYNDYLLKGGACDVLGTKLYESRSHIVLVGFHRAIGEFGPFPGNMEALETLIEPLCNAAKLQVELIDAGYRSAIASGGIEPIAIGAIFTDADGRIVETNEAGERILCLGDGLTMRHGEIGARRRFEATKLAHLIAGAAATTAGDRGPSAGCTLIGRDGGRPSYVVRVAPTNAGLAGYDHPLAMILVSAPDEDRVTEHDLAELYGLSPSESRLAMALAHGQRMTDLAGEYGVQITTLRTQLSSVLKKCEVERQSDLVRLILSIPVTHPLPSEPEFA